MPENDIIKFSDLKNKIREHLNTAIGIGGRGFKITSAKKTDNEWKVNVEYEETSGIMPSMGSALFTIDAKTGEVLQFEEGRLWRF